MRVVATAKPKPMPSEPRASSTPCALSTEATSARATQMLVASPSPTMRARPRSSDPPTVSPSFRWNIIRARGPSGGVRRARRRCLRSTPGMHEESNATLLEAGEPAVHAGEHALVLAAGHRHDDPRPRPRPAHVVAARLGAVGREPSGAPDAAPPLLPGD